MKSALRSVRATTLDAVENVTVNVTPTLKQQLRALADLDDVTLVTFYKRAIVSLYAATRARGAGAVTMSATLKPAAGVRLQLLLDEKATKAVRRMAAQHLVTRRVVCYSALLHYVHERALQLK